MTAAAAAAAAACQTVTRFLQSSIVIQAK